MNSEYVFFFNNMKKEMGNINCNLNEIIKIYESLIDSIENFGKDKINNQEEDEEDEGKTLLKNKFIEDIEDYKLKINEVTNFKNNTDSMIQENCEHNYILDTIDSGIDSSINIEYCDKCYKVRE
jgi:hypothetical protein